MAGQRHHSDDPSLDPGEQIRAKPLIDIPGAQEQQGFGDGVKRHVQHQGQRGDLAADAESRDHDAGLVDRGIRQEAPEVLLDQNKRHRNPHRKDSEQQQQVAGVFGAEASLGQHIETHESIYGAVQYSGRQNRGRGDRRFTVGVRLPGVHRREARLGAVTEQHQDKRHSHAGSVQMRRLAHQHRPVQTGQSLAPRQLVAGVVRDDGAEERHGKTDAADHGVFPGSLDGGDLAVEGDQEDRGQGGQLDGRPHDAQVIRHGDQQHREHKQRREGVVFAQLRQRLPAAALLVQRPAALVLAEIPHGIHRAHQGDRSAQQDHQRAQ